MYHFRILDRFPDRRLCIDFNDLHSRQPIGPSAIGQEARPLFDWHLPETNISGAPKVNPTLAVALTALELGTSQSDD